MSQFPPNRCPTYWLASGAIGRRFPLAVRRNPIKALTRRRRVHFPESQAYSAIQCRCIPRPSETIRRYLTSHISGLPFPPIWGVMRASYPKVRRLSSGFSAVFRILSRETFRVSDTSAMRIVSPRPDHETRRSHRAERSNNRRPYVAVRLERRHCFTAENSARYCVSGGLLPDKDTSLRHSRFSFCPSC